MIRLLGLLAVLVFAVVAVTVVMAIILTPRGALADQGADRMPGAVRIVSFIVLLLLLTGLSLGWIGGL